MFCSTLIFQRNAGHIFYRNMFARSRIVDDFFLVSPLRDFDSKDNSYQIKYYYKNLA